MISMVMATSMNDPSVIVLILSYNGRDLLDESVASYLACDYLNFRVAVIDNGSTDGTKSHVETNFPGVKVLRTEKNLGYAGGMNFGLAHAFDAYNFDYALLSNNDVRVDSGIVSALVATAQEHDRVGFVTGKIFYYDNPKVFQSIGRDWDPKKISGRDLGRGQTDAGQFDEDREVGFCDDVFWLISKEVYLATGGYDPQFFLQAEDFDWQLRAKNAGFRTIYAHKAKLWHKVSATIGKSSPEKAFWDARNRLVVVMKNLPATIADPYVKRKVWNLLVPTMIKQAAKGKLAVSYAMFRGLLSALAWRLRNAKKDGSKTSSHGSAA